MSQSDFLETARQQLAEGVTNHRPPCPMPLQVSDWIAMSLLHKATRRGREALALRAAATLLQNSPERLWRRCGGMVFEDIGLGDLETVSVVTVALAGKRFRATMGGEWPVASFIVSRMARAVKCRAADDLLMSAELHPAHALAREELATKSAPELLNIVAGSAPLVQRALALWYAAGVYRRPSPNLRSRQGDPQAVFDLLGRTRSDGGLVEITREGFRKVREVLCPFLALLEATRRAETAIVRDDQFPPEILVGEVPGWAYDTYTREGRAALQVFLQGSSETAHWVRSHVPLTRRVNFLGGVLFRVEGGLVRRRLRWPTADELRCQVDLECHAGCPNATEVLHLMREDISMLNEVRAHVC